MYSFFRIVLRITRRVSFELVIFKRLSSIESSFLRKVRNRRLDCEMACNLKTISRVVNSRTRGVEFSRKYERGGEFIMSSFASSVIGGDLDALLIKYLRHVLVWTNFSPLTVSRSVPDLIGALNTRTYA